MTKPKKKGCGLDVTDRHDRSHTERVHARCKYLATRLLVLLLLKLLYIENITGFGNLHFYFLTALAVASTVGPCEV